MLLRVKWILCLAYITIFLHLPMLIYAQEADEAPDAAYVIPIKGEIDRAMMVFIRRGIQEAEKAGVGTIIFEIDTFGGRVDSALQITTLIGSVDTLDTLETIAFVPAGPAGTGVSWSAGALISFSCSTIYMASGTSMGAAAPVFQTAEGMETAPEKMVSAIRAQMASLAEKNGYPKGVALAMVDMDVELIEVFLDGELLAATSEELPELERQAQEQGKELVKGKTISREGKLLTLTAGEMERYGVSSGTVNDLEALLEVLEIPESQTVSLTADLPDKLVAVITGSLVTSLLVMVGLITLYLEITSPGFGVPGTIAIIAFAIIFLGSALLGTVGSLELLLFLVGVILLVVEIFLIPGFGVTGVSGIVLIVLSLVLSRQDFVWPEFEWQWDVLGRNILIVGVGFLGSIVLIAVILKLFPRAPVFNRLILTSAEGLHEGYTVQSLETSKGLMGEKGKAVTALRPAGKAEINSNILVVETDGEFLEAGSAIEVIEVSGNRIVVRGC